MWYGTYVSLWAENISLYFKKKTFSKDRVEGSAGSSLLNITVYCKGAERLCRQGATTPGLLRRKAKTEGRADEQTGKWGNGRQRMPQRMTTKREKKKQMFLKSEILTFWINFALWQYWRSSSILQESLIFSALSRPGIKWHNQIFWCGNCGSFH